MTGIAKRDVGLVAMSVLISVAIASSWGSAAERGASEGSRTPRYEPILAPVEFRRLSRLENGPLKVREAPVTEVSLSCGTPGVITRIGPATGGAEFQTGQFVAEVQGRPVIVILGEFPFYRRLKLGTRGPDARQLNLAVAGADVSEVGASTLLAARGRWAQAGYGFGRALDPCETIVVPPGSRFVRVKGGLGASRDDAVLKVSTGPSRVEVQLAEGSAFRAGQQVELSAPATGADRLRLAGARVRASAGGLIVTATVPDGAVASLAHVTAGAVSSKARGRRLPTVPLSAITTDAAGRTRVRVVQRGSSELRWVDVVLVSRDAGWAQLRATRALRAGAGVVVGGRWR